ncbi:MAG TPA: hypothetical protein VFQ57_08185 [Sphingomonas sp.]|jgi:hypothetical protein|nr:hypothetical protein [Sphingomonas sp.]
MNADSASSPPASGGDKPARERRKLHLRYGAGSPGGSLHAAGSAGGERR